MAFTFTQLTSDSFQRANESPINPANWTTVGGLPATDQLSIVNDICVTTVAVQSDGISQNNFPLPNDQYLQVQLVNLTANGVIEICLRDGSTTTPTTPNYTAPKYRLFISGPFNDNTGVSNYVIDHLVYSGGGVAVAFTWAGNLPFTFHQNDVVKFAVVGQQTGSLYFYVNNQLVFSGLLNQSPAGVINSGKVDISVNSLSGPPGIQSDAGISDFSAGSVTTTTNVSTTYTVQDLVHDAMAYPLLAPVLGESSWSQQPALQFANTVMQFFLAQTLDWKFNRQNIPPFLTVGLQQDYVTQITNLSWLEQAWRIDINNSVNAGNQGPKPVQLMEAVRDLGQTSYQGYPFNVSWVPNSLAIMGQWTANTLIPCSYGQSSTPTSPIQQFIDKNGNILYIDSTQLGLTINSPGFTNIPIALPTPNPYGTTGTQKPFAPVGAVPGTIVQDNTVTWTVADPAGVAMRLAPLPALNGLAWLVMPIYQMKPPILKSLQNTISPIPNEYVYMFREGFLALCYEHADSKQFAGKFAQWKDSLVTALRSGDREREDATFYPSESLSGGSPWNVGFPIGPANPFMFGLGY